MTTVPVFRSTERMSRVAETRPLRMANRKSLAARAEAPSRTPSLSNAETLAVTSRLKVFAARPDPWPSAMITDRPPPGRSTISTVSPLSRDAYLLVLATATSMVKGMRATLPLGGSTSRMNAACCRRFYLGIINQACAPDLHGDEQSCPGDYVWQRLQRAGVDECQVIDGNAGHV